MTEPPTREQLEAAHCWWDAADRVPGRPEMTEFRRRLRYHQAQWREANGHPIGTQPLVPRPSDTKVSPVGSRIPLGLREGHRRQLPHQERSGGCERPDLVHRAPPELRSPAPLGRSPLFGGDVVQPVRRSGGRPRTGRPCGSRLVAGRTGDRLRRPLRPLAGPLRRPVPGKPQRLRGGLHPRSGRWHQGDREHQRQLPRADQAGDSEADPAGHYGSIAERSGVFAPGAIALVNRRSDLLEMWLRHLLLLSMLQHPSGTWAWGRHVVLYPEGSPDFVEATARYSDLLVDRSTFSTMTIEDLLDSGQLPTKATTSLRRRYVPG